MNICIVDDHKMFLEGITSIFEQVDEITVVGTANNGEQAIKLLAKVDVDIVITDIDMPTMDGIALTKVIKEQNPDIKVLAVSSYQNSTIINKAIKAGMNGYIIKNTGKIELLKALTTIFNDQDYFSNEVSTIINNNEHSQFNAEKNLVNLSEREKQILQLIAQEKSTKEIAEELFISVNTVETHRKNLMRKIGTKNMIGLVKYAIQQDIV